MVKPPIPIEDTLCPDCKGPVDWINASYSCGRCDKQFPFQDGVLNFLPQSLERSKLNENEVWRKWQTFNPILRKNNELRFFQDITLNEYRFYGHILEIGAGSCWASSLLKHKFPSARVYASDISVNSLKRGRQVSQMLGGNIDCFVACDIERLPFRNVLFDWVLGNSVLHHLHNPSKGLGEIARVLRNDGKYVGTGELIASPPLKLVWESSFGQAGKRAKIDGIYERVFTLKEMRIMFHTCGFGVHTSENVECGYKDRSLGFNYLYYLAVSGLPKFVVRHFLASDVSLYAKKDVVLDKP
jgi:ubiquinone/menaquinone biosynthesis C-methylase UbiE